MNDVVAMLEADHRRVRRDAHWGITHHVKEEEGEMFPKLRSSSDAATLEALGRTLQQAKAAAGLPPFDPESVSKAQLLDFAREAGIEGRSKMTKRELQRALS